jgi:hypothetical protein
MECPVCGNTRVEDITPQPYDGKTFRCISCGEFDIVNSVYEPGALKALDPSKRKDALARAQIVAIIGKRPRITNYDL